MRDIIRRSASVVAVLAALLACFPLMADDVPASPSAGNNPVASPLQPPTKPAGPSAETIKKAVAVGLKPEVQKGVTVFCWKDASTGSHFSTKKCVDDT